MGRGGGGSRGKSAGSGAGGGSSATASPAPPPETTHGIHQNSPLTKAEGNAAYDYSGIHYSDVNNFHRFGKPRLMDEGYMARVSGLTKNLDSAIRKGSLARDTIVYRGASLASLGGKIPKRGSVMSDKGYLSTSTNKGIAANFGHGVTLKITARKGTRALDVSHYAGGAEHEVLFRRGARLKVKSTSRDSSGHVTINAEMMK